MKYLKFYFILFFIVLFSIQQSSAITIIVEDINKKYNLAKNRVNCMHQDSIGFLWFGMANGLYKFDMNSFTKFDLEENKFFGFPESDVRAILEYKAGLFLIGTYNKGLLLFNSTTEKYDTLSLELPFEMCKLSVNYLCKDKKGIIWIGSNIGLMQVERDAKNGFKLLNIFNSDNTKITTNDIVQIKESPDGKIWFLTITDIGFYNYKNNILETVESRKANSAFIFIDPQTILKSCFETGLDIFNTEKLMIQHIEIGNEAEYDQARYIFKDHNSNIWLSISNVGLLFIESIDAINNSTLISNKDNNYSNLTSNVIYSINESNDGTIWLCTEEGITMMKTKPDLFHSQTIKSSLSPELNLGVRSLLNCGNGYICTGTISGGLHIYNTNNENIRHIPLIKQNGVIGKNIQAIITDFRGDLWIGTEGEGVIRASLKEFPYNNSIPIINYRRHPAPFPEKALPNDYVMGILEDHRKNIWIGTWEGLCLIDSAELRKTNQSKAQINIYLNDPSDQYSISNNIIMSLYQDREGTIWAGTQKGLNKIIKTNKGYKFKNNFININGENLTEKKILVMLEDKKGNFWFSTQDGGICRLNRATGIYEKFDYNNGFHDYIVNSIIEDSHGILWMGTNNGICKLNPKDFSFSFFNTEDGLISNDFFFNSCCRSKNQLFFGCNKGICFFSPDKIGQDTFKQNLVFTDFKLFNKSILINSEDSPLNQHISTTNQISLKHDQNYIILEFAALNYKQHNDLLYECKLVGLETNWNKLYRERKITYTNLKPGHYTFKVKAYNTGHKNNANEISLDITVKPPLWKTTWAYITYTLFIFFLVIKTYKYFINEEKKKHSLAIERINAKRIHEMDLMKLQFYTNISHELRTPLTLISAPLDSLADNNFEHSKCAHYYKIIQKNVHRLKSLINQLLDLRKLEEGFSKLEFKRGDIVEFIRKNIIGFENYAEKRKLHFTFQTEHEQVFAYFDFDKMEKILFNLLSNAFKYTPDYGTISLKLNVYKENDPESDIIGKHIKMIISDSGVGIPKDDISKIFDPFEQVCTNKPIGSTGIGIGLSLTKQLIELLHGKISVQSTVNKGSVFTVILPVLNSLPIDYAEVKERKHDKDEKTNILETEITKTKTKTKPKGSKPLLLIVEDNNDLRAFLIGELEENYNIIEADNGLVGYNEAVKKIPDLIVSDVVMERMNGIELCQKLKNDERTSHIPIILLTARHSEDAIQDGYEIGADDYITKPFNVSILKTRIANLIYQRRTLRKLFSKKLDFDFSEIVTGKLDSQFLKKLNTLIEKNLDNPDFGPVSLASDMAMSKMQLYRKTSALTNQTVYNYIRTKRMHKAAQLLLTTDNRISEIAVQVGYTEPSNFTKCFSQEFNQTPSNFIKAHRNN